MYGIEQKLYDQLLKLKDEYGLKGIKAEHEAEGSAFRDVMRLRKLTVKAGIKLYVKIGGVEAIRDIKDCLEIGVDGLVAPMVETKFGVKKFADAVRKFYKEHKIHLTLNLETKNAMEQIDDILEYAKGRIDNITIGRTDLSASYFDDNIYPDSDFIIDLIDRVSNKIVAAGLTLTVGGSLSNNSIKILRQRDNLRKNILKLETRKVMLPTATALDKEDSINQALKFEELYILSKKEFSDLFLEAEIARLTQLKRRL